MRATELAVLYLLIGSCSAIALLAMAKERKSRMLDAAILLPFWPLYGPFLLIGRAAPMIALPSTMIAPLAERLTMAKARITEIDRLLAQPELDERSARARLDELLARGDDRAAASVQSRLTSIERLRRLRQRFDRELTEIDELLAQLRVQSEVLRLAGGVEGNSRELVDEIASRVDGLEAILSVELEG
jgi:hypothetical protein